MTDPSSFAITCHTQVPLSLRSASLFSSHFPPHPLIHRYHDLLKDPFVQANYHIVRYGRVRALYHALSRSKLITKPFLDVLFQAKAQLSRYFLQSLIRSYAQHTTGNGRRSKATWGGKVTLTAFAALVSAGAELYGEWNRGKDYDDSDIFLKWFRGSMGVGWPSGGTEEQQEKYELDFTIIEELFTEYKVSMELHVYDIKALMCLACSLYHSRRRTRLTRH